MKNILKVIPIVAGGLAVSPICRADLLDNLPTWADVVNNSGATANGVVDTFAPAMYLAIGIAVGIFAIKFVIGLFRSM